MTQEVKEIFTSYLEKKELRRTNERYAILDEIYAFKGHFDVEALYVQMKNQDIQVSRATVYNTLDLLVECGLVSKHQFGQNQALYEKSYGSRQHDHLICTDCQKVIEFCDPRIQNVQKSVEDLLEFKVLNHSLLLYGTCQKSNCENRKK